MEQIKNFEWNDLMLYSKGWYESTGNLAADVAICLEKNENRMIRVRNKMSEESKKYVAKLLMDVVMPSFYKLMADDKDIMLGRATSPSSSHFYERISEIMRWDEKTTFHDAVIYDCVTIFRYIPKSKIKLNKPVYGKGRRRISGILHTYPKSTTYKTMNRIASKFFDKEEIHEG